jgi:hypothetical protein
MRTRGDKIVANEKRLYSGACHCGRLQVGFETAAAPKALTVRACQCGFCRRHGARTVSDPAGRLWVEAGADAPPLIYRFGLQITDYLMCPACGCYVAALMEDGGDVFGIVNIRMLEDEAAFAAAGAPRDYDAEDETARRGRRRHAWTPVTGV